MKVLKITEEQKDILVGKQFHTDCYFNPILDNNSNWIISLEERDYNTNEEINWLGDLEEIDYEPIIVEYNGI
jgi:hypothetical protein